MLRPGGHRRHDGPVAHRAAIGRVLRAHRQVADALPHRLDHPADPAAPERLGDDNRRVSPTRQPLDEARLNTGALGVLLEVLAVGDDEGAERERIDERGHGAEGVALAEDRHHGAAVEGVAGGGRGHGVCAVGEAQEKQGEGGTDHAAPPACRQTSASASAWRSPDGPALPSLRRPRASRWTRRPPTLCRPTQRARPWAGQRSAACCGRNPVCPCWAR